jgi:hypothetical protein
MKTAPLKLRVLPAGAFGFLTLIQVLDGLIDGWMKAAGAFNGLPRGTYATTCC